MLIVIAVFSFFLVRCTEPKITIIGTDFVTKQMTER